MGYWGAQKPDPVLRCPLDRTHLLARGLWGAWIFNQYAGRFWVDAVTSRLIDMTGPVHTRGGLILQNGLGRYGSIQGRPPDPSNGFTIAARASNDGSGTRQHNLVSRWPAWGIYFNNVPNVFPQGLCGKMTLGSNEWSVIFAPFSQVTPGTMMSLAMVYDPITELLLAYVSGQIQDRAACYGTVPNQGDMWLATDGRDFSNSLYHWAGQVDYLYIYERALIESEVNWLYREPYDIFQAPEPVRFYSIPQ